jgi:tRNA (guanine37-N1)-methyltransferase
MGNPASLSEESHGTGGVGGLLEYPLYTKPASWRGLEVPAVLTSGNHALVARWRRDQGLRRTADRRPDLIAALDPAALDAHDRAVLAERADRGRSADHAGA